MEFEGSLQAQDNVKKKAKNIPYFEWIFFFTEDQKKIINESIDKNRQNLYSWLIFTIALPLLTYTFAVLINLVLTPFCDLQKSWALILNNGSLPIAAFGIISSGVPYLMESMRNPKDEIYDLRKRIMAIATVFMFLTSGLFLFQSISPNIVQLNNFQSFIISILSILFTCFAVSTGIKMYLLQSTFMDDFATSTNDNRDNLTAGLNEQFGS